MNTRSTAVAGALAALFATTALPHQAAAQADQMVRCQGVNDCKGQGGCQSTQNACKGQNGCKGQSFTMMREKDCREKGGTIAPPGQQPPAPSPNPPPQQPPKT